MNFKKVLAVSLTALVFFAFIGCSDDDGGSGLVLVTFESVVAADGVDGTADTTELTLTFSADPTNLAASHIAVTGATKGALSGTGTTRTLAISNITVANGETVSVEITSPSGFTISGSPQTAVVYKSTVVAVTFESAVQTGGTSGTTETTGLTLTFDVDPGTLSIDDVTVTGARKVSLSGTGTNRTLTIADINVANEGTVTVAITSPSGYTITGSPQSATVYRITESNMTIGMDYRGGKLAYILQSGDPGYDAGVPHGIIVATNNQNGGVGVQWGGFAADLSGTDYPTGTALGDGKSNTETLVRFFDSIYQSGDSSVGYYTYDWTSLVDPNTEDFTDGTNTYALGFQNNGNSAAKICADYEVTVNGITYDDWYLPSKDELDKLYDSKFTVGGYEYSPYWSSSELDSDRASTQYFDDGFQSSSYKYYSNVMVRAIRSF